MDQPRTQEASTKNPADATPTFDLDDYRQVPVAELMQRAEAAESIEDIDEATPAELVFAAVQHELASDALGRATGVLDVRAEGFGFLRSRHNGCRPSADDAYLSPNQVRRLRLRHGQEIAGVIRLPRPGERYFAMVRVERVDDREVADENRSTPFAHTTPVLPHSRLMLADGEGPEMLGILDTLAPLARGQRVLIHAPRDAARGELLGEIAAGVVHGDGEETVLMLLVDQEPEVAASFTRAFAGFPRAEVYASTLADPPERHVELLRLLLARAQRLVEARRHAVLVVDSLTQLVRACNASLPHSGKILAAGLDAHALLLPKELFASARQTEEGPSLTVIATLLGGGALNETIADEFQGHANADIVLDPELIRSHVNPPFDVHRTRTREEDLVLTAEELAEVRHLRAALDSMPNSAAIQHLLDRAAAE